METISVKVGNIYIGGGHPIVVQTMCNTHTSDIQASVEQCRKLAAAGAMKNLYVYFYNEQTDIRTPLFDGKEVHVAFGVEEGTIVNTGITSSTTVVEQTISVDEGFLFTTHGDFYIVDEQGRESHIPTFDATFNLGDAPYGICVPYDWKYPREYVSVINAYPTFVDWAGDVNVQDWYTTDKADANSIY